MDQTRKARRHKCGVVADGDEEAGHVLLEELSVKRGRETTKKQIEEVRSIQNACHGKDGREKRDGEKQGANGD